MFLFYSNSFLHLGIQTDRTMKKLEKATELVKGEWYSDLDQDSMFTGLLEFSHKDEHTLYFSKSTGGGYFLYGQHVVFYPTAEFYIPTPKMLKDHGII